MGSLKLKPCPFCGSNDVEAFAQYKEDCPDRSAIVRCHGCDAQSAQIVGQNKVPVAVRKWNLRVDPLKSKCDALETESAARGEIIERLIGQYSAAGYHAVQNSLNPAQSLLYDAMQVMKQPTTDAYLNSVRADAISSALNASSNHCDTDCVMDAYDCSYEIAEIRSAGAIALHDGLVAYANELRAGKDGE